VTWAARLAAGHDRLTGIGYGAAGLCLAVIPLSFWCEIVSRYFFNSPTEWASPLVSYCLCAMIFLALPEITRRVEHIAMNTFTDSLPGRHARLLRACVRLLAALACLLAAWFSANETLQQFTQDIRTIPPFAVPKWIISIWIPYGMLSAGTHFLRQHVAGDVAAGVSGAGV